MPIVNYVREHIRFMEYASDENLTSAERLLWYALMHIMNQRAQGNVWPGEFVRISNDRLLSYCPMKYDTILTARNSLKQRGLIDFNPGKSCKKKVKDEDGNIREKGSAVAATYRMIYFYPTDAGPEYGSETEKQPQERPKNSDAMGYGRGDAMGYGRGDAMGYGRGDYNINNKQYSKPCQYPKDFEEDDDEEEAYQRAHARAREEVFNAWVENFGKQATPAMAERLARISDMMEFGEGVLHHAIANAACQGVDNPMGYIVTVLNDWKGHNVKTLEDAQKYDYIYDALNGRRSEYKYHYEEALQLEKEFTQDRESPEQRRWRLEYEAGEEEKRRQREAAIQANQTQREQEKKA